MSKYLIMLSLLAFLTSPAWTQDEEAAAVPAQSEETDVGKTPSGEQMAATEDEIDDSDLDEQTYEEDDDDSDSSESGETEGLLGSDEDMDIETPRRPLIANWGPSWSTVKDRDPDPGP